MDTLYLATSSFTISSFLHCRVKQRICTLCSFTREGKGGGFPKNTLVTLSLTRNILLEIAFHRPIAVVL